MINSVVLVGRLTKDIELRKTNSNISTCTFTLAVDRRFKSTQEGAQTADFINCVAWRQAADYLGQYAAKGGIVAVEGSIQTRNYEGQNGRVYVTEVVCDNVKLIGQHKNTGNNANTYQRTNNNFNNNTYTQNNGYNNNYNNVYNNDGYNNINYYGGNGNQQNKCPNFTLMLVFCILSILFLSKIVGAIALVFLFQANNNFRYGYYDKYESNIKICKILLVVSVIVGIFVFIGSMAIGFSTSGLFSMM